MEETNDVEKRKGFERRKGWEREKFDDGETAKSEGSDLRRMLMPLASSSFHLLLNESIYFKKQGWSTFEREGEENLKYRISCRCWKSTKDERGRSEGRAAAQFHPSWENEPENGRRLNLRLWGLKERQEDEICPVWNHGSSVPFDSSSSPSKLIHNNITSNVYD